MKIYSADTWTLEELRDQLDDVGRRALVIPPADTRRDVLTAFGEVLRFPEDEGISLDALNDSLQDLADTVGDEGQAPVTLIWQVPSAFRANGSFGVVCETLQDAESYAGKNLAVIAVCL